MAIREIVSSKNTSSRVIVSIDEAQGMLHGQPYHTYGPAYLQAEAGDGRGHNYQLWLEEEPLPKSINNGDIAMATAKTLFADKILSAKNLNVIELVRLYGGGEYVADLRGTAWWVED